MIIVTGNEKNDIIWQNFNFKNPVFEVKFLRCDSLLVQVGEQQMTVNSVPCTRNVSGTQICNRTENREFLLTD